MTPRLFSHFFVLATIAVLAGPARAQAKPSTAGPTGSVSQSAAAPATRATVTLAGRVETPDGPLSGAVVKLLGSRQQPCVTNSDGLFFFTVPADSGPFSAVASYTGSEDVPFTIPANGEPTVVQMTTPKLGKKDQKQLKASIKRGKRETKRSLHKLK